VARAFIAIAAVGDMDGDGKTDIVAYSSNHVYVVAAATGAIEWVEPDGEIAAMGSVHVGDVTGDGKPDVVVAECGCCGVNSGNPGFIWTFGGGFAAAKSTGSLPVFSCGTSYSVTLGDAAGNGHDEVLEADYSHFALTDGNGAILAQTGQLGTWMSTSVCAPANVDGLPGDEFICIQNSPNAPATNQRKVFVLHYDATAKPPVLDVVWSKVLAPDAGGDIRAVDPVTDLDGDGQYEIVVSAYDPNVGWQTHVMDAGSGAELVSPFGNGAIIQGTATIATPKTRTVLTGSGTSLTGWAFSRVPPMITQKWQINGAAVLTYARPDLLAVSSINRVPVALDLDGDGVDELVVRNIGASGAITAYSAVGASATAVASYSLPTSTDPLSAWVIPGITTKSQQVSLVGTDGIMRLLDNTLNPALDSAAKPSAIRVGGYYGSGAWREMSNAPRVRALSSGKSESIVIADSRRALNRIEGVDASWAIPPVSTWSATHTFAPTIVDNLASTGPGVACLALKEPVADPPAYVLRTLRADGSTLWEAPLDGSPLADVAPGDFNGDGTTDFVVQEAPAGSTVMTTRAFSGSTGTSLWTNGPSDVGGAVQSPGVAIARFGSSATDDIYYQASKTIVLSGSGSVLKQGGSANSYGLPVLVDTLGVGANSVVMTAGYSPVAVFSPDLQTPTYVSSDDDRPYPYGAVAKCGGSASQTLVEGSWANQARLKFTQIGGGAVGTSKTVVLAGGKLYADEAAAKSNGAFLGQLTAANVDANLGGANHPIAVVGSTDGWLYGVNPCDGTLQFALDMGASVGEAVFGDTDGDGRDEIIVTAADGYLYDIKNQAIAQPSYVWDTDPDHGIVDHDVDTIATVDKLSGAWAPVAGATGYEVTIVTKEGKPVPNPVWKNVGATTTASLTGLPLIQNTEYFFVVRALSATGPSVDSLSNGVTVVGGGDAGLDAGSDDLTGRAGGCACDLGTTQSPTGAVAGLALALASFCCRRRKRTTK
jgi:hypothetical protein